MTDTLSSWFADLETLASATVLSAKKNANRLDDSIWQLPSGKYIAMKRGEVVPPGSIRVAHRLSAESAWKNEERTA